MEVQALEERDVDLEWRRIRVERSVDGPVKDNDLREVLILDTLVKPLRAWLLQHEGKTGPQLHHGHGALRAPAPGHLRQGRSCRFGY